MSKRFVYSAGLLLLMATIFFIASKNNKAPVPEISLNSLDLFSLDGNQVDMRKFTGKPLVVNFWATWCGPCRKEFPAFNTVFKTYGEKVNFLMVSAESIDKILQFKAEQNYSFPYAHSVKQLNALGIKSIPFTCFYDADGTLVETINDELDEEDLNKFVLELVQ